MEEKVECDVDHDVLLFSEDVDVFMWFALLLVPPRDLANISSIEVVIVERFIACCRLNSLDVDDDWGIFSEELRLLRSNVLDKSAGGMPEKAMFQRGCGLSLLGVLR